MTVIATDHTKLDAALAEVCNTILLLSDDPDPVAERVHDKAEQVAEDWQRVFLPRDPAVLKPRERHTWFAAEGHYVVVGYFVGSSLVPLLPAPSPGE